MNSKWILNSSCFFDMSPDQNIFLVIEGDKVLIENNLSFIVASIRNIKIKIFNRVVRELK